MRGRRARRWRDGAGWPLAVWDARTGHAGLNGPGARGLAYSDGTRTTLRACDLGDLMDELDEAYRADVETAGRMHGCAYDLRVW